MDDKKTALKKEYEDKKKALRAMVEKQWEKKS